MDSFQQMVKMILNFEFKGDAPAKTKQFNKILKDCNISFKDLLRGVSSYLVQLKKAGLENHSVYKSASFVNRVLKGQGKVVGNTGREFQKLAGELKKYNVVISGARKVEEKRIKNLRTLSGKVKKIQRKITEDERKEVNKRIALAKREAKKKVDSLRTISIATAGLTYGFTRLGVGLVDVISEFEQYRIKLTAVTGAQKKAVELLEYMKDYAARTPFDVKELAAAGVQLRVYEQDVKRTLPLVAALATVMDRDIHKASLAFGRAMKGSTYGFRMLRESFGITTMELKKFGAMTRKSRLILHDHEDGVKRAAKALQSLIQAKYGHMMELQSNTLKTSLVNVRDEFHNLVAEMEGSFAPAIKAAAYSTKGLVHVLRGVNKEVPGLVTFLGAVGTGITGLAGIVTVTAGIAFAINQLKTAFGGLSLAMGLWGASIFVMTTVAALLLQHLGKQNEMEMKKQEALLESNKLMVEQKTMVEDIINVEVSRRGVTEELKGELEKEVGVLQDLFNLDKDRVVIVEERIEAEKRYLRLKDEDYKKSVAFYERQLEDIKRVRWERLKGLIGIQELGNIIREKIGSPPLKMTKVEEKKYELAVLKEEKKIRDEILDLGKEEFINFIEKNKTIKSAKLYSIEYNKEELENIALLGRTQEKVVNILKGIIGLSKKHNEETKKRKEELDKLIKSHEVITSEQIKAFRLAIKTGNFLKGDNLEILESWGFINKEKLKGLNIDQKKILVLRMIESFEKRHLEHQKLKGVTDETLEAQAGKAHRAELARIQAESSALGKLKSKEKKRWVDMLNAALQGKRMAEEFDRIMGKAKKPEKQFFMGKEIDIKEAERKPVLRKIPEVEAAEFALQIAKKNNKERVEDYEVTCNTLKQLTEETEADKAGIAILKNKESLTDQEKEEKASLEKRAKVNKEIGARLLKEIFSGNLKSAVELSKLGKEMEADKARIAILKNKEGLTDQEKEEKAHLEREVIAKLEAGKGLNKKLVAAYKKKNKSLESLDKARMREREAVTSKLLKDNKRLYDEELKNIYTFGARIKTLDNLGKIYTIEDKKITKIKTINAAINRLIKKRGDLSVNQVRLEKDINKLILERKDVQKDILKDASDLYTKIYKEFYKLTHPGKDSALFDLAEQMQEYAEAIAKLKERLKDATLPPERIKEIKDLIKRLEYMTKGMRDIKKGKIMEDAGKDLKNAAKEVKKGGEDLQEFVTESASFKFIGNKFITTLQGMAQGISDSFAAHGAGFTSGTNFTDPTPGIHGTSSTLGTQWTGATTPSAAQAALVKTKKAIASAIINSNTATINAGNVIVTGGQGSKVSGGAGMGGAIAGGGAGAGVGGISSVPSPGEVGGGAKGHASDYVMNKSIFTP